MIAFEHVGKRYGGRFDALAHLNFRVARGEMVFLTGHSGAGKSSLLRLIMRLETPSRGRVVVAGHDIAQLHPSQVPFYRRQIGVVFQDHQLLFDRSVFHNVSLPLEIQGVEPREAARRVRAVARSGAAADYQTFVARRSRERSDFRVTLSVPCSRLLGLGLTTISMSLPSALRNRYSRSIEKPSKR